MLLGVLYNKNNKILFLIIIPQKLGELEENNNNVVIKNCFNLLIRINKD
jgi:hypothetical protein